MRSDDAAKGIGLFIAAMLILASNDAVIKFLAQSYPALQIVWARAVGLTVLAFVLVWVTGSNSTWRSARPRLQLLRSFMLLASMLLLVIAFRLLPLADAHALIATAPLMATALAALVLNEKIGLSRWLSVLICFIGVLIILRPGITAIQPASLVALLGGFCIAGYMVITRMVSQFDSDQTSLLFVASVALISTSAPVPFVWVSPSAKAWLLLGIVGFSGAFAQWLLIKALEMTPASVLQPFNYVLLLCATLLGVVVFEQIPDFWTMAGAVVVVASGLFAFFNERRRSQISSMETS